MTQSAQATMAETAPLLDGTPGVFADWASDQRTFKNTPWGKAMMWIFLLSDTFIFSCFLISYGTVRMSTTIPWPNPSEVFALTVAGNHVPLLLIAIMTFVLITSSGTMALAVNYGYRKNKMVTFWLLLATALLGAMFVGMQAFEWTKLIVDEGVRPWANPMGAPQFGGIFFMVTGFHGTHVSIGVLFLAIMAVKVVRGKLDREEPGFMTGRKQDYGMVDYIRSLLSLVGKSWHQLKVNNIRWVFISRSGFYCLY